MLKSSNRTQSLHGATPAIGAQIRSSCQWNCDDRPSFAIYITVHSTEYLVTSPHGTAIPDNQAQLRESTNGRCCYIVMRFISRMSLQLQTDEAIGQSYIVTGPVQSTVFYVFYRTVNRFTSTPPDSCHPSSCHPPTIKLDCCPWHIQHSCHTQFNNHPIQHQSYNGKHNHNTQVHPIQNRRATMDPIGFPAGASLTISGGSSSW